MNEWKLAGSVSCHSNIGYLSTIDTICFTTSHRRAISCHTQSYEKSPLAQKPLVVLIRQLVASSAQTRTQLFNPLGIRMQDYNLRALACT